MAELLDSLRQFNFTSVVVRLFLAMAIGGLIGFERERKRRPAGFRTYMLVAIGAALTVVLSEYLNFMLDTRWAEVAQRVGVKTDVSRFGAQVINGVGFLGAGTIIVTGRQEVKGLTTAAGLWASACMGLAVGAGFYECVFIGFVLVVFCMNLLPLIEDAIMSRSKNVNFYVEMDNIECLGAIAAAMKAQGIRLFDTEINKEQHGHISQVNAVFNILLPKKQQHAEILAMLSTVDGIISIEEI